MPDTALILNSRAGSADRPGALQELARLGEVAMFSPQAPGEAAEMAVRAVEAGCRTIVAGGGDGTLNEVVNGLAPHWADVRLGLLPLGTGNDFARTVGIPVDLEAAITILLDGTTRKIDVVRVIGAAGEARYFLNVSAGGFSTVVDQNLTPELKSWLGTFAYPVSAMQALSDRQGYRLQLELDEQPPLDVEALAVVVANARFVAGGIQVAPQARPDDGLLDVIAFPALALPQLALLASRVLVGQHLDSEQVVSYTARRVRVTSDPPYEFNADGELAGHTPALFEVVPQAVTMIVGPMSSDPG